MGRGGGVNLAGIDTRMLSTTAVPGYVTYLWLWRYTSVGRRILVIKLLCTPVRQTDRESWVNLAGIDTRMLSTTAVPGYVTYLWLWRYTCTSVGSRQTERAG